MTTDGRGAAVPRIGHDTFAAALQYVDEVIVGVRESGTITFASPSVRTVFGWDAADIVGRNVLDYLDPDVVDQIYNSMKRWSGRDGQVDANPIRVRTALGTYTDVRIGVVAGPSVAELGDFVVTARDPSTDDVERRQFMQRLSNEGRLVRLASTFLGLELDEFESGVHEATLEIAGLRWVTRVSVWQTVGDEIIRRAVWEADDGAPLVPLVRRVPVAKLPELAAMQELHYRSADEVAASSWSEAGRVLVEGGVKGLLAVPMNSAGRFCGLVMVEHTFDAGVFDTTHFSTLRAAAAILAEAFARNEAERELAARASTDLLTGLPNRWTFQAALDQALEAVAHGTSCGLGVALFDLDRFKSVNDSLGHDAGDRLLFEVAERLRTMAASGVGPTVVVARLGGDEFLLLVDDAETYDDVERRVAHVLGALAPPFEVDGRPVQLTASVGLVHVETGGSTAAELLRRADLAMFRAKGQGGGRFAADDEGSRRALAERGREESDLKQAIGGDGLLVHLQGEWDLHTGQLIGAEALARWQHPRRGLVAAGEFIALAEESDLVVALGERVLLEACRKLASWRRAGFAAPFVLRVNISARQLRHPTFVEQVADALELSGLDPSDLCLELTESSLLVDPTAAATTLAALRDLGCGLAVDDFGTGYSSLLYLKNLPLSCIKIDQVFVAGLPQDSTDRAIVSCIVELAASLGVTVTAEGVETESQRSTLIEIGCQCAQGFLLSVPEPMDEFADRLVLAAS